jgi:hypothetical protein
MGEIPGPRASFEKGWSRVEARGTAGAGALEGSWSLLEVSPLPDLSPDTARDCAVNGPRVVKGTRNRRNRGQYEEEIGLRFIRNKSRNEIWSEDSSRI